MVEISNKWLKEFIHYHKPSSSFLVAMNMQLTEKFFGEFDVVFDTKNSFLVLDPGDAPLPMHSLEFKQIDNCEIAFLYIFLYFPGNVYVPHCKIIWFDQLKKKRVIPTDSVSELDIQFEWQDLVLTDREINLLKNKPKDIRSAIKSKVAFKVLSFTPNVTIDVEMHFKLMNEDETKEIDTILQNAQMSWNTESEVIIYGKNVKTRGLIHSVRFLRMEETSAVFAIDLGSSGLQGFHHLLNSLDESEVVISEVELKTF